MYAGVHHKGHDNQGLAFTMILRRLTALALSALLFLLSPLHVRGSALTTTIGPNEKLCFYADVDKEGEKIGVSNVI